jgi:hypothetical protein
MLKRSEKLSAENGALRTKLSEAAAVAVQPDSSGTAQERGVRSSRKDSPGAGWRSAGLPVADSEEERLKKLVLDAAREHHQKELRSKAGQGASEQCFLAVEEEHGADSGSIASSELSSVVSAELATAFAISRGAKLGSPGKVYSPVRGGPSGKKAGASNSTGGSPGYKEQEPGLQGLIDSSSYEGQLLESVLANWPANSRISRVVKQLMADVGPQAKAASTCSRSSFGHNAVSAKEQLRRLMQMSPIRQRLAKSAVESIGASGKRRG